MAQLVSSELPRALEPVLSASQSQTCVAASDKFVRSRSAECNTNENSRLRATR
jgi:hypothetical protein